MRLLPAIIIAIAIVLAPVLWFALPKLFENPEDFQGTAIDSGARIDIEMLSQQVEDLGNRVEQLDEAVRNLGMRGATDGMQGGALDPSLEEQPVPSGPNEIIDAYAQVVLIANRLKVNDGLLLADPGFLVQNFGLPREDLTDQCQDMTNPRLSAKLVTENVGPITVRMLKPAIDSLRTVFDNVRKTDPDLYDRLSTAGSLCVRLIRGSANRASSHAYGLAVDLNVDGRLDTLGDGRTQLGLTIMADFFKAEGWLWGAAWQREDSMHFEVSRQKLQEWIDAGSL
ncbi:M15 family metallopeptidase [Defluviimonas sp. WL0024]|uniref:M15 family metallopeptidase n=1 Tax=Albidovulum salinarum TaxID=2984153 RepID=A0ABT2X7F3_9RHOB|nr:M15 family metallopeptidase [Defluviimonas sp. WL0024]MCU9849869.1 M15 family metallopeptidase [Defluviimonas sp. WL0024]